MASAPFCVPRNLSQQMPAPRHRDGVHGRAQSQSQSQPKRRPVRVSLACEACRYKHLRCDAEKPTCRRCRVDMKACVYPHSRRGNRATRSMPLAKETTRIMRTANITGFGNLAEPELEGGYGYAPIPLGTETMDTTTIGRTGRDAAESELQDAGYGFSDISDLNAPVAGEAEDFNTEAIGLMNCSTNGDFNAGTNRDTSRGMDGDINANINAGINGSQDHGMDLSPNTRGEDMLGNNETLGNVDKTPETAPLTLQTSPMSERLLSLYYEFFHAAHPCVLPHQFLRKLLAEGYPALQPLLEVMQFIGSLFYISTSNSTPPSSLAAVPVQQTKVDDGRLVAQQKAKAQDALAPIRKRRRPITGFDVQAVLLYSIAIYWCNEMDRGIEVLDEAINMALDLGMNRNGFAVEHGQNDPILEESWRRTWWMIYITDAHIAGSTQTFPFRTNRVDVSVDLPCEEESYSSGNIPPPRTLQEYDTREFVPDESPGFSSFAELVGLTRAVDLALSAGGGSLDVQQYTVMCANADTGMAAWHSLLPRSQRELSPADGVLDEVLFKAHFIMHTYTVVLHRPLSTLAYSPIEAVSCCAPQAPSERLHGGSTAECQLHTLKCLRAIEHLDRLLTLPTNINITTHSPFIVCMIANATIAHLAACRYVLSGQKLAMSREKIRLTMGTLKVLSEHWPLGKRTYQELGIIAREILSLSTSRSTSTPISAFTSTSISIPTSALTSTGRSTSTPTDQSHSILAEMQIPRPDDPHELQMMPQSYNLYQPPMDLQFPLLESTTWQF